MILYSTNVLLKFHIQQMYFNNIHYVWCSEAFDSTKLAAYTPGNMVAPSSNPVDIYRQLKNDVTRKDRHSYKINEQQTSLKSLATRSHASGLITEEIKEEIFYKVDNATFEDWTPLIYIIPKQPVIGRIKLVPIAKRASNGLEYIIEDLNTSEFDVIEP